MLRYSYQYSFIMRMAKYLFAILLPFLFAFALQVSTVVDEKEAQRAFEVLNEARTNPKEYGKRIELNLDKILARHALSWNDTLAKVAQQKAADMAKRKYFNHVTPEGKGINVMIDAAGYKLPKEWLKNKQDNYFESIVAGVVNGEDAIKTLIIDSFDKNLGHRRHLLGTDDWNASLKDVGIGYVNATGADYNSYVVVIIAKRNW